MVSVPHSPGMGISSEVCSGRTSYQLVLYSLGRLMVNAITRVSRGLAVPARLSPFGQGSLSAPDACRPPTRVHRKKIEWTVLMRTVVERCLSATRCYIRMYPLHCPQFQYS